MLASQTDKHWHIGYVSGSFDMFHVGHLNLIRRAKERCDYLIVGILSDEAICAVKNKPPVIPLSDRMDIVSALRYVDETDVTTEELLNKVVAWEKYHFDAMFSGDDHINDGWRCEEEALKELGAELVFFPYTKKVSTTLLRDVIACNEGESDNKGRQGVAGEKRETLGKLFDELRNSKVVLFGAGKNGKYILKKLLARGIAPAYFVDNNSDAGAIELDEQGRKYVFNIYTPQVLLDEDEAELRIIITPLAPFYMQIETQLRDMMLEYSIFSTNIRSCRMLAQFEIGFFDENIGFCCASQSGFNKDRPKLQYSDTADETINNILTMRDTILYGLNGYSGVDVAKPCIDCTRLNETGVYNCFDLSDKISAVAIDCYPAICQAKCIYCKIHDDAKNTYDMAAHSKYPKIIAEIISRLKSNNYLADNCYFSVTPAEITIMPHKELVLKSISGYNAAFFTNGFKYDLHIASFLESSDSLIYVSLDSGTRETFKLVKGFDLFDTLVENLLKYRNSGNITIKYNIMVGINDGNDDIDGIITILKKLNVNFLQISFDYLLPLRTAFHTIARFVQQLNNNNLTFSFHAYYSVNQIEDSISNLYTSDYQKNLKEKTVLYRNTFFTQFINNYNAYRRFVYILETKELIKCFKEGTRFALLGQVSNDENIVSTFYELAIPLMTPDLPYSASFDATKDCADIFILCNKEKYKDLKMYAEKNGVDGGRILNIEEYYYSFEPVETFLEKRVSQEYLCLDNSVYNQNPAW